jgi:predicted phosphate transport protein (TIGR00153 family)
MLGWFQALMPKEERFFELFSRHTGIILAGAEALEKLFEGGNIEHYCKVIFDREAEADEITREVLKAVRRTFITPFDRTDIQDLVSSLDDSIDQMNKTAKLITLYEVKTFEPQMQQMAAMAPVAARLVQSAMPLLSSIGKNSAQLHRITEQVIAIEEKSDQLHDAGRKALFLANRNGNAMNFIIGGEIYDHLEKVVDRFEDVANEISALVTDHL